MKNRITALFIAIALACTTTVAFAQAKKDTKKADTKTSAKTDSKAPAGASDADIAAAKSAGKVWVNTSSKVYHKGGQWYGKTKQGKFMTEADAKAAGFRKAIDPGTSGN